MIKLEEKRATTPPPFDAVKAQLGPLVNQKKFETYLKDLVKSAEGRALALTYSARRK